MAPLEESLRQLAELAERLSEHSEGFNETILRVEGRLDAAGVDVGYWLDDILDESSLRDHTTSGWSLGYDIAEERFRVVVKRVRLHWALYGTDSTEVVPAIEDLTLPIPLIQAPRVVRAEAAPLLENLVVALTERIGLLLERIETARPFVDRFARITLPLSIVDPVTA